MCLACCVRAELLLWAPRGISACLNTTRNIVISVLTIAGFPRSVWIFVNLLLSDVQQQLSLVPPVKSIISTNSDIALLSEEGVSLTLTVCQYTDMMLFSALAFSVLTRPCLLVWLLRGFTQTWLVDSECLASPGSQGQTLLLLPPHPLPWALLSQNALHLESHFLSLWHLVSAVVRLSEGENKRTEYQIYFTVIVVKCVLFHLLLTPPTKKDLSNADLELSIRLSSVHASVVRAIIHK